MDAIEPDQLYSFAEACRFIPSCRAGKRLALRSLHRWRERGVFEAEYRDIVGRRFWFIRGRELLRLLGSAPRRKQPAIEEEVARARRHIEALRRKAACD